ncbi:OmpA family protein [Frankia sp. QA3]|uniref:OmpA family protein n=1 Tax=Frankia sp. QA3 TaxID=710111 RepID=UPI000269C007|nr:OmpA family protein [Frankia sp. QA3]EIV92969.1 outer membrane protein/peptidoglycan-associated (lipo)protein [Frankia sp. QA3]
MRPPWPPAFAPRKHKELGDATGRSIDLGNGSVLSWGDIVALAGDQYGSLDDLLNDTRNEQGRQRLRAAVNADHVRTPRADVIGWYRANFGPPVVDATIRRPTDRLVDALTAQADPRTRYPTPVVRLKIRAKVNEKLNNGIAELGGHARLVDLFALGVAGGISGALHDLEGRRGVMVTSEAHPEPWRAYGDDQPSNSPVSQAQAELSVRAAAAQTDRAVEIGRQYHQAAAPSAAPSVSYFALDSADLDPAASASAAAAGEYLRLHPEMVLTVTGHTDPTGGAAHTDQLGLRRAQAVADRAAAAGARADQQPRCRELHQRRHPGGAGGMALGAGRTRRPRRGQHLRPYQGRPRPGRPGRQHKTGRCEEDGIIVRPRIEAQAIVAELLADPASFLERAFGQPMSP